jgi:hypothetical protein
MFFVAHCWVFQFHTCATGNITLASHPFTRTDRMQPSHLTWNWRQSVAASLPFKMKSRSNGFKEKGYCFIGSKVNKGNNKLKLMSTFHLFFRRRCSRSFFFSQVFLGDQWIFFYADMEKKLFCHP